MSDGLDTLDRGRPGRWAFAAAMLAEDIRFGITIWPLPFEFQQRCYRDMKQFFLEIEESLKGEIGPCRDSYHLSLRALGCFLETPLLVVKGEVAGITKYAEARAKLAKLAKLFSTRIPETAESAESEWKELANFLERIKCLDEADIQDRRYDSGPPHYYLH